MTSVPYYKPFPEIHMYHGTSKTLEVIHPQFSRLVHSDVVFASTDIYVAACFIPKWTDAEVDMGFSKGQMYLRELVEGALDKWHIPGNIYLVEPSKFMRHDSLGLKNEFICYSSVVPEKMYPVSDVFEFIEAHFDIYRFGSQEKITY